MSNPRNFPRWPTYEVYGETSANGAWLNAIPNSNHSAARVQAAANNDPARGEPSANRNRSHAMSSGHIPTNQAQAMNHTARTQTSGRQGNSRQVTKPVVPKKRNNPVYDSDDSIESEYRQRQFARSKVGTNRIAPKMDIEPEIDYRPSAKGRVGTGRMAPQNNPAKSSRNTTANQSSSGAMADNYHSQSSRNFGYHANAGAIETGYSAESSLNAATKKPILASPFQEPVRIATYQPVQVPVTTTYHSGSGSGFDAVAYQSGHGKSSRQGQGSAAIRVDASAIVHPPVGSSQLGMQQAVIPIELHVYVYHTTTATPPDINIVVDRHAPPPPFIKREPDANQMSMTGDLGSNPQTNRVAFYGFAGPAESSSKDDGYEKFQQDHINRVLQEGRGRELVHSRLAIKAQWDSMSNARRALYALGTDFQGPVQEPPFNIHYHVTQPQPDIKHPMTAPVPDVQGIPLAQHRHPRRETFSQSSPYSTPSSPSPPPFQPRRRVERYQAPSIVLDPNRPAPSTKKGKEGWIENAARGYFSLCGIKWLEKYILDKVSPNRIPGIGRWMKEEMVMWLEHPERREVLERNDLIKRRDRCRKDDVHFPWLDRDMDEFGWW